MLVPEAQIAVGNFQDVFDFVLGNFGSRYWKQYHLGVLTDISAPLCDGVSQSEMDDQRHCKIV